MLTATLSDESAQVVRELNPWWFSDDAVVRPGPPAFRRPPVRDILGRLRRDKGLIEAVRGPRQVGKTTAIFQIIQDLIREGRRPRDIMFVRFDLELLREEPSALRSILQWYTTNIRGRSLTEGAPCYLFLDEIHKLRRWHDEIKHIGDTFPVRMLLTGSSSVLVARGGRESLAGRIFTTEFPTFSFREVLECWRPQLAECLPPRIRFQEAFGQAFRESAEQQSLLKPQQKLAIRRTLERYYFRGGYPRLHSGEVDDDVWADYLVQTVFDNVLGADIPDLFPVERPQLLRHMYLSVARLTDPALLGPLVETLAQHVMRDHNMQVHYFREHEIPNNFRSPIHEVDFVVERLDGQVLPIEVKFHKRIREDDLKGLLHFGERHKKALDGTAGVVVTRELAKWDDRRRILFVPLGTFLLLF